MWSVCTRDKDSAVVMLRCDSVNVLAGSAVGVS